MDPPVWLVVALLSCLLWAVLFVLDAHLVGEVFDRPWLGAVASGAFSAVALPGVLAWAAADGWPTAGVLAGGLLTGAAFVGCQVAHFEALRDAEAGVVAAYWSLTPVFVVAGGFALLGERLTAPQYAGVAVVVAAAVLFSRLDTRAGVSRWRPLGVMAVGCLLHAGYFLGQKAVFDAGTVRQGFAVILAGMAVAGLAPLGLSGGRRVLRGNWPRLRRAGWLLLLVEAVHLLAVYAGQWAVDAGTPSLVAVVEAAIPGLTFLVSMGLFAAGGRYGEGAARRRLPAKLLLVGVMGWGVWLLI